MATLDTTSYLNETFAFPTSLTHILQVAMAYEQQDDSAFDAEPLASRLAEDMRLCRYVFRMQQAPSSSITTYPV
jgi:hypothetical protein